jgi:hypothetical protein
MKWLLEALHIVEPVHLVGNSFDGSLAPKTLADGKAFGIRSVTSICGTGGAWKGDASPAELPHWDGTEKDLRRIVELLIDGTVRCWRRNWRSACAGLRIPDITGP